MLPFAETVSGHSEAGRRRRDAGGETSWQVASEERGPALDGLGSPQPLHVTHGAGVRAHRQTRSSQGSGPQRVQ